MARLIRVVERLLALSVLAIVSLLVVRCADDSRQRRWPWVDRPEAFVLHVGNELGQPLLIEYRSPELSREWSALWPHDRPLDRREPGDRVEQARWVAMLPGSLIGRSNGSVAMVSREGLSVELRAWAGERGEPAGACELVLVPDLHVELSIDGAGMGRGRVGRASWLGPVTWQPAAESGG